MKKIKILFISLFLVLSIAFNTMASEANVEQEETQISIEEELKKASDETGLSGLDLILYSLNHADGEIEVRITKKENSRNTTLSERIISFLENVLMTFLTFIYKNIIYIIIIVILSLILFIRKRKAYKKEIEQLINKRKRGE